MISDPSDVFAAKSTDRGVLSYLKTDPATMALGSGPIDLVDVA